MRSFDLSSMFSLVSSTCLVTSLLFALLIEGIEITCERADDWTGIGEVPGDKTCFRISQ